LLALFSHLLNQTSATLWLIYAGVALLMLLGIVRILPQPGAHAGRHPQRQSLESRHPATGAVYALYGVGYIIPATFLSQMANAQFHGQWQADLFWPCFGLGAAIGVLLVSLRRHDPNTTRHWLTATLWLQAPGSLPVCWAAVMAWRWGWCCAACRSWLACNW
jgi:hypothetical protein